MLTEAQLGTWRISMASAMCMLLLTMLILRVLRREEKRSTQRALIGLLVSADIAVLFDLLWGLSTLGHITLPGIWSRVVSACYHIGTGVLCYACFAYSETVQQSSYIRRPLVLATGFIPLTLLAVLCISSIWTGCVFWFDKDGSYRHGAMYWAFMLLAYNYPIFTGLTTWWRSMNRRNFVNRSTYRMLAVFVIPLICSAMLQELFPTVPILCVGITIGAILVYILSLENQISIDGLTGLNNRMHLIRHLSVRIRNLPKNHGLYVFMLDANGFKRINDGYGHPEGDRALCLIGQVMKQALAGRPSCFLARYGGDEFTIVCETEERAEADAIPALLESELQALAKAHQLPYVLTLSIGMAEFDGKQDIPTLIGAADRALYHAKNAANA
ncbi:MAG: GGDEF domain-containing protein [Clostridia bacterium]|nr:GGDEF domain-containing protein [Clostridia bacterium]